MTPDSTRPAGDTKVKDRAAYPPPGTWTFDKAHTRIEFIARHMLSKVRGRFSGYDGTVTIAERPEDSHVEVEIQAASLSTDTEMRDDHLRSDDFLEVETYPTISFRSTELRPTGENTFDLVGKLTIKDITRTVVLKAEFNGWGPGASDDRPPLAAFSAATEINREDWDMTWNMVVETGGLLVSKSAQIEIETELNLQQP
ncbi:MAG TPA: YceI family protein [Actinomycetota bacterium]|nr:YceI family protein [Actinomycetota bacterium]